MDVSVILLTMQRHYVECRYDYRLCSCWKFSYFTCYHQWSERPFMHQMH